MEKALTGLISWVDARLPMTRAWNTHMGEYYAPKNFNLWYFFGVFSLLVLVNHSQNNSKSSLDKSLAVEGFDIRQYSSSQEWKGDEGMKTLQ